MAKDQASVVQWLPVTRAHCSIKKCNRTKEVRMTERRLKHNLVQIYVFVLS